jgi:hypothetical protein
LYVTFETKTGGIFVTKVKPVHGVQILTKRDTLDVVLKKQDVKLMDRLLKEHFSVPYDDTQPSSSTNGFIRIPIKELLNFRRSIPEGAVDF